MAKIRPMAISVSPMPNYFLMLEFDNGERRVFDVKPYIRGAWFGKLADIEYFNSVSIGGLSVEWPDEQDICPDCLYAESVPVKEWDPDFTKLTPEEAAMLDEVEKDGETFSLEEVMEELGIN